MKISIILETVQDLGDHGREIEEVIEPLDGETVQGLAERILKDIDTGAVSTYDSITIKAIREQKS